MSRENISGCEVILGRIKKAFNLKRDLDLALFLGVDQSTISNWKSRGSLDYDLIISKCKKTDLNWLFGTGEMGRGKSVVAETEDRYNQHNQEKNHNADMHSTDQLLGGTGMMTIGDIVSDIMMRGSPEQKARLRGGKKAFMRIALEISDELDAGENKPLKKMG